MPAVSHQTIKLSRGKHSSPQHGACVMELASMLAGERFSDHPHAVSRVLAAFLRGYNDLLDDERRQDLYRYAALSVGTADGPDAERARMSRLIEWADERWNSRPRGSLVARLQRARIRRRRGTDPETAASYALRTLTHCQVDHLSALRLTDELIAVGSRGGRDRSGGWPEGLELAALGQLRERPTLQLADSVL